jgi:hypothetical protein
MTTLIRSRPARSIPMMSTLTQKRKEKFLTLLTIEDERV